MHAIMNKKNDLMTASFLFFGPIHKPQTVEINKKLKALSRLCNIHEANKLSKAGICKGYLIF